MTKQLLYFSVTGVTRRAAEKFGGKPITEYDGESEYVLMLPSYGSPRSGEHVPKPVRVFLQEHSGRMVGVIGIGNRTFGSEFCMGAIYTAKDHNVPLVTTIDMVPSLEDNNKIKEALG